jgi:hypothetical protein
MIYTEKDLRKAFHAGSIRGIFLEKDEYAPFYIPLDEDEYIDNLKETVVEEDEVSFTYSFLRRKIDWEEFCDLTGFLFYITESKAKRFNLI